MYDFAIFLSHLYVCLLRSPAPMISNVCSVSLPHRFSSVTKFISRAFL